MKVDDLVLMQLEMESGALGTVEASRLATGTNDELRIEIYGDKGAIYFNLMDPNWLWIYDTRDESEPIGGRRGFKRIETVQRYPEPAVLPGPKFAIGWMRYHLASQYEFIRRIVSGQKGDPDFFDGYEVQKITEAALLSAARKGWVDLSKLE